MCEGGVATWNRSSGPSPRAAHQCAVACPMESWVWRTALGRPVVPELKTSTDSAPSRHVHAPGPARPAPRRTAGGRLVVEVGHRRRARAAPASKRCGPRRRPRRARARSAPARAPTSALFHAGLRSGRRRHPTCSRRARRPRTRPGWPSSRPPGRPGRTPASARCRAKRVAPCVELARRSRSGRRPGRRARSSKRPAARSSPRCIGPTPMRTFFSHVRSLSTRTGL